MDSARKRWFRETAIVSPYACYAMVLANFGVRQEVHRSDLIAEAGLGTTQGSRILRDAVTLGLLERVRSRLRKTPLGLQWEADVRQHGTPTPGTLRAAALTVPLFAQLACHAPDCTDPQSVYEYLRDHAGPDGRPNDIGSARRRYLEAVHGLVLPRTLGFLSPRMRSEQQEGCTTAESEIDEADIPEGPTSIDRARWVRLYRRMELLDAEFGADRVHAFIDFMSEARKWGLVTHAPTPECPFSERLPIAAAEDEAEDLARTDERRIVGVKINAEVLRRARHSCVDTNRSLSAYVEWLLRRDLHAFRVNKPSITRVADRQQ